MPVAEAGANRNRGPKAQEFRFQGHGGLRWSTYSLLTEKRVVKARVCAEKATTGGLQQPAKFPSGVRAGCAQLWCPLTRQTRQLLLVLSKTKASRPSSRGL